MTNNELPTVYQQFIHKSRYARWIPEESRRETWAETVTRYCDFMWNHLQTKQGFNASEDLRQEVFNAIFNLEVMPSMRAMMTAGEALARDHIAGFNCSFVPFDNVRAFDEALYILMCGTGVGFSVERQFISKLPTVTETFDNTTKPAVLVEDSKQGWAVAIRETIEHLYNGIIPIIDTRDVRPAGARLKTFGGRASGPAPLIDLFNFIIHTFTHASGRRLNSTEVHDIACKIGESVVVGGVRRSALISLSNLSDQRMRDAKSGSWWEHEPQRRLANNSVAYTEKPEVGQWLDEWSAIYHSKSGERGIFNRGAAIRQCDKYGRDAGWDFGTNPCGEIILRPNQFCNLSEIVCRADDTHESLARKVEIATFIGTFQSSLTDYSYIREEWSINSKEERLLGVSMTGIMDCPLLNGVNGRESRNQLLNQLREVSEQTNREFAGAFGIEASAAITCVKPSGTVSQLVNASSGIHSRYATSYIRRARNDGKDPLTGFMIDAGIPMEKDLFSPETAVFSFPIQAPSDAITRNDRTAIEELETWLDFKTHWCHHNPSVTINVRDNEVPTVGAWIWEHFDEIAGVSFLPHDDHVYQQAPYEEVGAKTIAKMQERIPAMVDWSLHIEDDDNTTGTQELACTSGVCEIN